LLLSLDLNLQLLQRVRLVAGQGAGLGSLCLLVRLPSVQILDGGSDGGLFPGCLLLLSL
jgi:hypothetical protein